MYFFFFFYSNNTTKNKRIFGLWAYRVDLRSFLLIISRLDMVTKPFTSTCEKIFYRDLEQISNVFTSHFLKRISHFPISHKITHFDPKNYKKNFKKMYLLRESEWFYLFIIFFLTGILIFLSG